MSLADQLASIGLCGIEMLVGRLGLGARAAASIGLCGIEMVRCGANFCASVNASIGLCGIEMATTTSVLTSTARLQSDYVVLKFFFSLFLQWLIRRFNRTVWY